MTTAEPPESTFLHAPSAALRPPLRAEAKASHGSPPYSDLQALAAEVRIRAYATGETLQRDGDDAMHVMNIRTGSVKVYKQLADGRRAVVGFLFAGDFFGLAALEVYSSGVEALEPVQAWRFPRAAFRQLVAERPRLEAALLRRVARDLESAQEQMLLLSRKTAMERLTTFILQLALREPEDAAGHAQVHFQMTRADMADYLGLTTETVSRCFTRLRGSGLIRLEQPTSVVVLHPRRLRDVAAGAALISYAMPGQLETLSRLERRERGAAGDSNQWPGAHVRVVHEFRAGHGSDP
ncbi:Crp/Fnr family transcriptional regulator [uncultured Phenylobacterium sp.]|uniref:Crp/Fnr family transcriptional regulator n=1 Tax=uncultured Phenylobacterium sp. TaxID=349273 RepID=UPI0025EDE3CA|nr:Crp/Fnr family transcriptional regulator [uncultured Phenylobacterium sp.]